jgi:diaminopimelate decarboxylase
VAESKFGIDRRSAIELLRRHAAFPDVRIIGIHLHIGSQITESRPFVEAIRRGGEVIRRGRGFGIDLAWLNLGGGLGIVYKDERPQTPRAFATAIGPQLRKLGVRLILEPGRFIVGNAGVLVTEVLYVKRAGGKRMAVVDAGMNDLIRPALYGAYHEVLAVSGRPGGSNGAGRYDVVGPICESADVFARDRRIGSVASGARLAVLGAGAYGFTMASNYNGRPRPAEVLVHGARWALIRRRETMQDLIRHDVVPRRMVA